MSITVTITEDINISKAPISMDIRKGSLKYATAINVTIGIVNSDIMEPVEVDRYL